MNHKDNLIHNKKNSLVSYWKPDCHQEPARGIQGQASYDSLSTYMAKLDGVALKQTSREDLPHLVPLQNGVEGHEAG